MTDSKGTYIFVVIDDNSQQNIQNYINNNNIPNPVADGTLHCTLIKSQQTTIKHIPIHIYSTQLVGIPTELSVWETTTGSNCLVMVFNCCELVDRHQSIVCNHNITHYQSDYISHITLSYDVGNLNVQDLPSITSTIPKILLIGEKAPICSLCTENCVNATGGELC